MGLFDSYYVECKLPELRKLRGFFEQAMKETREDAVLGNFGACGVFYGNAIQHCNFEIPASAMKLIYEHNRDKIDQEILQLEMLKKSL